MYLGNSMLCVTELVLIVTNGVAYEPKITKVSYQTRRLLDQVR